MKGQLDVRTVKGRQPGTLGTRSSMVRLELIAMLFAALVLPTFAQPQKRDCDNMAVAGDMSQADVINMRIDCRTENVNAELSTLVEMACQSGRFSERTERALLRGRERAESARSRTMEARGFRGLGRKQDSTCFLKEYEGRVCQTGPMKGQPCDPSDPHAVDCGMNHACEANGNDDGMCTNQGGMREICAEVTGDGIGDDDGVCEQMGNVKEVCVEICEVPLNDEDDENFDGAAAADYQTGLEDLEASLADANKEFAEALAARVEARQYQDAGVAGGDACQQTGPWLTVVRFALVEALVIAEQIHDICSDSCGNDVGGFNCKAACSAPATAKAIIALVLNGFDYDEEIAERSGYELQYECQGQTSVVVASVDSKTTEIKDTTSQTGMQVDEINEKVDALDAKVDALNARINEVLELLRTPPGRRPGFPKP